MAKLPMNKIEVASLEGMLETGNYGTSDFVQWTNRNTVYMFTRSCCKVVYFNYLGIVINNVGIIKTDRNFRHDSDSPGTVRYCVEVVKLRHLTDDEWELLYPEEIKLYAKIGSIRKMDFRIVKASNFKILRPALEFMARIPKSKRCLIGDDIGWGNCLACPITGVIYPVDCFDFDRLGRF